MSELAELLRDGARCNRSSELWIKFREFHEANPWIYDRLKEMCTQLRSKGFRHYSTRTVIHALRFEWDVKTGGEEVRVDGDSEPRVVKLNNNHSPYYARMLIEENRDFWDFFELRRAAGDPVELPPPPGPDGEQLSLFGGAL